MIGNNQSFEFHADLSDQSDLFSRCVRKSIRARLAVLQACLNDTRFPLESKARRVACVEKAPPGLLAERRVADKALMKNRFSKKGNRLRQPSCS
jgi:hypothetical protein